MLVLPWSNNSGCVMGFCQHPSHFRSRPAPDWIAVYVSTTECRRTTCFLVLVLIKSSLVCVYVLNVYVLSLFFNRSEYMTTGSCHFNG